jgi:hypothetical protein
MTVRYTPEAFSDRELKTAFDGERGKSSSNDANCCPHDLAAAIRPPALDVFQIVRPGDAAWTQAI